jgi:Protein of unknown function (DUF4232)
MTLRGTRPVPSWPRLAGWALPGAVALTTGALATTALAACGSARPAPAAVPAAVAACPSSALRVALDTGVDAVAAGSSYLPLDFTNATHSACRLTGYPDVAFVSGVPGHRIGGPATRYQGVAAHPVTLAPGATAHAWLVVSAAANYPAGQCHPVTAHALRVQAPGQAGASYVRHDFPACAAASLRGGSILAVQPVQPGRAKRGTAQ